MSLSKKPRRRIKVPVKVVLGGDIFFFLLCLFCYCYWLLAEKEYNSQCFDGGIAQLGERLPRKQGVIGSIPFTSTTKRFSV